jgi:hypothetical protein
MRTSGAQCYVQRMGNDVMVHAAVVQVHTAVDRLTESINRFNVSSDRYSKRILWLTWVIAVLTLVMTATGIMAIIR